MSQAPPGSSVLGIFQARILEWFAFLSPGDLPDPGIKPATPVLAGRFFTAEPSGKPKEVLHSQKNSDCNLCPSQFKEWHSSFKICNYSYTLLFIFIVFFNLFFKFYFIFKLYIIVSVLPNIKMNPPQVYRVVICV